MRTFDNSDLRCGGTGDRPGQTAGLPSSLRVGGPASYNAATLIDQTLGHYRITAKLGEGGMGEVWKAEDERLGREVAIKVLPERLVADPDRLSRFEREARLLASLNHPNIGAIYDVGQEGNRHFLVLELAEGETLEQRLQRGAIATEEATRLALQIAEALEVAHEQGIVHRDLKPGNVMVSSEGRVKVVDFGLAKDWSASDGSSAPNLSASPTLTANQTAAGVLLGTAAYMSPEQARGQSADKRTDIWAFGCVLWEMLSGSRLFAQATVSDTLAAVLRDEITFESLPKGVPEGLLFLIGRCLERDPLARLRDIGEVRIALQGGSQSILGSSLAAMSTDRASEPGGRGIRWSWILVALLALACAYLAFRGEEPASTELIVTSLIPPEDHVFMPALGLAVAPDGRAIAYVAAGADGVARLWVRPLDSVDGVPIGGTDNAWFPFWSPDGRHLAFFASGELRRVPAAGGSPRILAEVTDPRGGTWSDRGEIVFVPDFRTGLRRISAEGGEVRVLTEPDFQGGEKSHRWPVFLEGGDQLVFLAQTAEGTSSSDRSTIELLDLASGQRRVLLRANSSFALARGQLIYWSDGDLYARGFDRSHSEIGAASRLIAQGVGYTVNEMAIAAAGESVLVYAGGSGVEGRSQLGWWSREGEGLEVAAPLEIYRDAELSHDGKKVAFYRGDTVWVRELSRGIATRLSFEEGDHDGPFFSADDRTIIYTTTRGGPGEIRRRQASGLGEEEELLRLDVRAFGRDISPDGKTLLLDFVDPQLSWDVRVAHLEDGRVEPLVATPFNEKSGQYSPDGRWVTYVSDESGQDEVFVVPASGLSERWQISTMGGNFPRWHPQGNEIAWIEPPGSLAVASVKEEEGELIIGESRALFELHSLPPEEHPFSYSPDGERFLLNLQEAEAGSGFLRIVQNWDRSEGDD